MGSKITGSFRLNRRKAAFVLASGAAAWGLGSPMTRVGSAQGATDNWNGADPSYSGTSWYWSADGAGGNWGSATPVNGDVVVFAGTTGLTNYNDLLTSVSSIGFSSGGGAFDLTGNPLTIAATTIANDQDNTAVETIGMNLTLTGGETQAFTIVDGGILTFAGNVSRTNSGTADGTNFASPSISATSFPTLQFSGTDSFTDQTLTNDGAAQGNGTGWTQREGTTVNLLSGANFTKTGGFFQIGQNGDSTVPGTMNVETGSTLNVSTTTSFSIGVNFNHAVTAPEAGILNVSGTVVAALPSADPANSSLPASADAEGYIRFGMSTVQNTTGTDVGTINLLPGGVLETSRQFVVGGTFYNTSNTVVGQTGYLDFHGGTLETDGTNSVTNWFPASATTPTHYNALTGIYISGSGDPLGNGAYINTNGANATISQPLTDNPTYTGGALTKQGSGVLTLSGTNSYTGATTISAGELDVTGSLAATSGVTVNGGSPGGTLGGTGSISASVAAAAGAAVTPGIASSPLGTLSTGPVTLHDNSTFAVTLNSDTPSSSGLLVVNGAISLVDSTGALLSVTDVGTGASFVPGSIYTIISATTPITTAFANLGEGATVTANNGSTYTIEYDYEGGDDVVLDSVSGPTPTPEPGCLGLLGLGGLGISRRRRRHKNVKTSE